MGIAELTGEDFETTVQREGVVAVDLWAAWCGPCRTFAPVYQAASERHPEILFTKVDVDKEPLLARKLDVRSIPTLLIYRDGNLVHRQVGAVGGPALDRLLTDAASRSASD